jgi:hypothetical protein
MSPEERNYPVADKEMLSVIRLLEQWHHYLEGAHHETTNYSLRVLEFK